jgi:hypothetical protein
VLAAQRHASAQRSWAKDRHGRRGLDRAAGRSRLGSSQLCAAAGRSWILREITRYRKALVQERRREAQRLHKTLADAGIKLGSVATNILGKSGPTTLEALIDGKHDADILADLAHARLR